MLKLYCPFLEKKLKYGNKTKNKEKGRKKEMGEAKGDKTQTF